MRRTDYCYHSIRLEEGCETIQKLNSEKLQRLSTTGEHVMDNVVILCGMINTLARHKFERVVDHVNMVRREVEVFERKLVDDRIDFNNGGFDPMVDQCSWSRSGSKSTGVKASVHLLETTLENEGRAAFLT